MAKKNDANEKSKCSKCKRIIKDIPFRCKYCKNLFCSKHRLPEDHNCNILEEKKSHNLENWQGAIRAIGSDNIRRKQREEEADNILDAHRYVESSSYNKLRNIHDDSDNNFWPVVLVIVLFLGFIWWGYNSSSQEADSFENNYIYDDIDYSYENTDDDSYGDTDYSIPDSEDFYLASRTNLPILYSISNNCSDYMKDRIRKAFVKLSEELDWILFFREEIQDSDIEIKCSLLDDGNGEYHTAGEATLGVIGYLSKKLEIDFYNLTSRKETHKIGGCYNYPIAEIHEILHTFGFEHNEDGVSIMNSIADKCYINYIDKYIIECLQYDYSDGEIGSDCSYRDDVMTFDEIEYEECSDGWYVSTNSRSSCCPELEMYIDSEGYCAYD